MDNSGVSDAIPGVQYWGWGKRGGWGLQCGRNRFSSHQTRMVYCLLGTAVSAWWCMIAYQVPGQLYSLGQHLLRQQYLASSLNSLIQPLPCTAQPVPIMHVPEPLYSLVEHVLAPVRQEFSLRALLGRSISARSSSVQSMGTVERPNI